MAGVGLPADVPGMPNAYSRAFHFHCCAVLVAIGIDVPECIEETRRVTHTLLATCIGEICGEYACAAVQTHPMLAVQRTSLTSASSPSTCRAARLPERSHPCSVGHRLLLPRRKPHVYSHG